MPTPIHRRYMMPRDFPEVLAIEGQSFDFPWTEDDLVRARRGRNALSRVAEQGRRVVGYMVYDLQPGHIRLARLAVRVGSRREGVGLQMVGELIGKLAEYRRARISLTVRETALAAQLFLRVAGFRATDVKRGHYPDTGEDAFTMDYVLPVSAPAVRPAWAMEWDGTREC